MAIDDNLVQLLSVQNSIYIKELISTSFNGGIVWSKISPDLYTTFYTEEDTQQTHLWEIFVSRFSENEGYRWIMDVLLDKSPYMNVSSTMDDNVETLFLSAESIIGNSMSQLNDAQSFFNG